MECVAHKKKINKKPTRFSMNLKLIINHLEQQQQKKEPYVTFVLSGCGYIINENVNAHENLSYIPIQYDDLSK